MKLIRKYQGRMLVVRSGGVRGTTEFAWSGNLIVDQGLDAIGLGREYLKYCKVGRGNTPVEETDTDLVNPVAIVEGTDHSTGASNVAPYYGWRRRKFSFLPGAITGIIKELGIFWGGGSDLFARALIRDDMGDPTEIDVQADEQIDVYYDLRAYAPVGDGTPSVIDLSSDSSGDNYTFTSRASYASNSGYWAPDDSTTILHATNAHLCLGSIGAVTSKPSGTSYYGTGSGATPAYVPGTYQRKFTVTWDQTVVAEANSIWLRSNMGAFQIAVSPPLPKTDMNQLELEFTFQWARHA